MNKKVALYFSLSIIVLFIIFMIYDSSKREEKAVEQKIMVTDDKDLEPVWNISSELEITYGKLKAVATTGDGIILAGDSFLSYYEYSLGLAWKTDTDNPIYAVASNGDNIYCSTGETILVYDNKGEMIEEWGPYDANSIITSIDANSDNVAFADAGNRLVFVLDGQGALVSLIGQPGDQFVIPSPYFDLSLLDDFVVTANPGKRNIEFRDINGNITRTFGEAGTAIEYFCGCCNPSHFAIMPNGNIVTAEKGINRIKIIDGQGRFIELVAQPAEFIASIPVDIAVSADNIIYGANPANSKLYAFKRNQQ